MNSTKAKVVHKPKSKAQDRPIKTTCPKCHKEHTVRGMSWDDLVAAGIDTKEEAVLERKCSSCTYREKYQAKPQSEEAKAKRSEYNKKRRAQINEALELLKVGKAQQNGQTAEEVPNNEA